MWLLLLLLFSLFWFGLKLLYIWKYNLIKAKLQLQNNDPNIQNKNKNDLKYFLYYNYKIFVWPFTLQCRKMVSHTLKILKQMLQDFWSLSDHFTTLRSKGLIIENE